MTHRDDQNALAVMVGAIYAARLNAYMRDVLSPKSKDEWLKHRDACIKKSITDAALICEAIQQDFPLSEG